MYTHSEAIIFPQFLLKTCWKAWIPAQNLGFIKISYGSTLKNTLFSQQNSDLFIPNDTYPQEEFDHPQEPGVSGWSLQAGAAPRDWEWWTDKPTKKHKKGYDFGIKRWFMDVFEFWRWIWICEFVNLYDLCIGCKGWNPFVPERVKEWSLVCSARLVWSCATEKTNWLGIGWSFCE